MDQRRQRYPITDVLLVACAVVVVALVVRRELLSHSAPTVQARAIDNWLEILNGGHLLYGRSQAPVQIVEFSDFECGACAAADSELRQVYARHPDLMAVVYRHYPIGSIHAHAYVAAVAAECASEQDAFSGYHHALFDGQALFGRVSWVTLAARARVRDTSRFRLCLQSSPAAERVTTDTSVAYRLGVRATPTFVVNGTVLITTPRPGSWDDFVVRLAKSGPTARPVGR